jgi:hypothetical protein
VVLVDLGPVVVGELHHGGDERLLVGADRAVDRVLGREVDQVVLAALNTVKRYARVPEPARVSCRDTDDMTVILLPWQPYCQYRRGDIHRYDGSRPQATPAQSVWSSMRGSPRLGDSADTQVGDRDEV